MIEITGMRPTMFDSKFTTTRKTPKASSLRIEPVDNWHDKWDDVLAAVERHGKAEKLRVDSDGWLSARQVIVVAFIGEEPAAHISFSIQPSGDGKIEAKVDSYAIDLQFSGRGIESQLHRAAAERAQTLRCDKLKGLRLNSKWC